MIAATYTQGGGFRVEEVPLPEMADDELLVEVKAASICGTDLRIVRNGHRKLRDGQRIILGHEFAGVLAKVGRRVAGFREGQRVGVAPNMGCGQCGMCARGLPNMCPAYTAFGITLDGAHTQYVRVPNAAIAQASVVLLPETMPFGHACLIEPFSCVVNASRAVRMEPGDVALVFGAGPIGLMHVMLADLCGASKVICVDVQPARLKLAAELGATSVVDSSREDVHEHVMATTDGRGADVVITACSVAAVQEQAIGLLAPLGRLCLFGGLPKDGSHVQLDTNLIHYKQLIVTGVTGGAPRDFQAAMALIGAGRVAIDRVVSHRFPMGEMAAAYEAATGGDAMKVVIQAE